MIFSLLCIRNAVFSLIFGQCLDLALGIYLKADQTCNDYVGLLKGFGSRCKPL